MRQKDRLYTVYHPMPIYNSYDIGGFINGLAGKEGSLTNMFGASKIAGNTAAGGLVQGVAGMVGNLGNKLLSDGLESKAGSAVANIGGTVGGLVGKVNPIAGGIVTAASGIIGGGINKLFGSKLNQENINTINSENNAMNNITVDTSSADSVMSQFSQQNFGRTFDKSYIGRDGVFSHKARNKFNQLQQDQARAQLRADASYDNAIEQVDKQQDLTALANYAACGGKLMRNRFAFGGSMSTQGGNYPLGLDSINSGGTHEQNPYNGVPMGTDNQGTPNFVEQGETIFNDYVFSNRIPIPDSLSKKYRLKKGISFSDATKKLAKEADSRPNDPISKSTLAGFMQELQEHQEHIKAEKEAKKARREFNKLSPEQQLAILQQSGNPVGGENIPQDNPQYAQGFALGGNLFDKGGDKGGWNPSNINPYGYADDYTGIGDYSWVDDKGNYLKAYQDYLVANYDVTKMKEHLKDNYSFFKNASKEDMKTSRYKAIKAFYDKNPEWLKNGDTIDSWNISPELANQMRGLAGDGKFGYMHTKDLYDKFMAERQESADPISLYTTRGRGQGDIGIAPEALSLYRYEAPRDVVGKEVDKYGNTLNYLEKTGMLGYQKLGWNKKPEENEFKPLNTDLRYAPVLGAAIGAASSMLSKPDESSADAILSAARNSNYMPISFNPVGNYLAYNPFDRNYYANKLSAESGATRRAIANQSNGNRGQQIAGLLAADYNAGNQLGNLFRQGEEYNLNQRQTVENFNRATNMFNSEGIFKADAANQNALMQSRGLYLNGVMQAERLRQAARQQLNAERSANLSNLFNSLGNIGRENMTFNMFNSSKALPWKMNTNGTWYYENPKK